MSTAGLSSATSPRRQSADERRESVLGAAFTAFAEKGLHGVTTDEIARAAGISQPYLFRLYRTKKELFIAAVERGFSRTLVTLQQAAVGKHPDEIFHEMGMAYSDLLASDRRMLLMQLQSYAACDDDDVREAVRRGFGELYVYVERVSGATDDQVRAFFATGMLLNVLAAMDAEQLVEGWAGRCLAFCSHAADASAAVEMSSAAADSAAPSAAKATSP